VGVRPERRLWTEWMSGFEHHRGAGIPHRAPAPYPCFVTDPSLSIRVSVHMNYIVVSCRSFWWW
jgi:hypothetical protein